MERAILIFAALLFIVGEGKVQAETEFREGWRIVLPLLSSNTLADNNAKLISSAGLSWPDGRQAIVTFWAYENSLYRCIDYFNAFFQQTGGGCYTPADE